MPHRLNLHCADCRIRPRAVCARCGPAELARLDSMKLYRRYEAGQVLARADEPLGFVGTVVAGVATLSQTLADGRGQMVGLLLPSDFLGRPGRDSSPSDVTAAGDVTLCCFRRAPFEQLLRDTPRLADRLLEMTLDELDAARHWMMVLGRKTARERIASLLLSVARRQRGGAGEIDLPLTREAMADYLGLTLETVSRQINGLARDGVIGLQDRRRVTIQDLALLEGEAGEQAAGA